MSIQSATAELIETFRNSKTTKSGSGPGGWPVNVIHEVWNLGLSPANRYFANNGYSDDTPYCSYYIDEQGKLWCNGKATRTGRNSWQVDHTAAVPTTSEDEIRWLIELLEATEEVIWGGSVDIRPRPNLTAV